MWNRRDVFDQLHIQSGRLQRGDGALATRPWSTDTDFDVSHAEFGRLFGGLLRRALPREGSAFAASLEATRARTGPTKRVAFGIGDRHGGVVECRVNVSDSAADIPANAFLFVGLCHGKVSIDGVNGWG